MMRTLTEHDAGIQTITDPAGGGFVIHIEDTTNTDTGSNIDTVVRHKTLTPQAGDTGEPQFTLHLEGMLRLVATPIGQFNPCFVPVDHLGGAGTVTEQQRKQEAQAGGHTLQNLEVSGPLVHKQLSLIAESSQVVGAHGLFALHETHDTMTVVPGTTSPTCA